MKLAPRSTFFRYIIGFLCLTAILGIGSVSTAFAQQKLSLADLLIALRSKKVTLAERNAILAEAVKSRGVTFAISDDIEKELVATGADTVLIGAIRQQSKPEGKPVAAVPQTTPTPAPDFEFYRKRADGNLSKGDFRTAVTDYDKAMELKGDDAVAFLNRGKAHYGLRSFDKAVADFDRTIDLDARSAAAYFNRGGVREAEGKLPEAAADYKKAIEIDAASEMAKTALKRVETELAKLEAAKAPPPVVEKPVEVVPEFLNMGVLTAASAIRMVTPTYSPIAQRSNIEGKVSVEIELDLDGEVTEAKAISGHQLLRSAAEDAAKRSKFKPAVFNGRPIKGKATIIYNFTMRPTR